MPRQVPPAEDIREAAARGKRISVDEMSDVSHEGEATSADPVSQNPAVHTSTPHSQHSNQRDFEHKVEEILAKEPNTITRDDARELQSLETRALGTNPGHNSLSAEVQSIADRNEKIAAVPVDIGNEDAGPYVTKDDAAE
ncbi:hypothetical protein AJ79_06209 [Helicocarpus griseus UAMH5409]|uniref:SMP domain-containing protein n=1 Tax=Helicocarpus griseus UAMH5409 TaxID=1447875 RepID=A0A2B7XG99_9EURO|nr:hypothetical protein AJ79_06209 [Helicocarpus griseus UAMH5409]